MSLSSRLRPKASANWSRLVPRQGAGERPPPPRVAWLTPTASRRGRGRHGSGPSRRPHSGGRWGRPARRSCRPAEAPPAVDPGCGRPPPRKRGRQRRLALTASRVAPSPTPRVLSSGPTGRFRRIASPYRLLSGRSACQTTVGQPTGVARLLDLNCAQPALRASPEGDGATVHFRLKDVPAMVAGINWNIGGHGLNGGRRDGTSLFLRLQQTVFQTVRPRANPTGFARQPTPAPVWPAGQTGAFVSRLGHISLPPQPGPAKGDTPKGVERGRMTTFQVKTQPKRLV